MTSPRSKVALTMIGTLLLTGVLYFDDLKNAIGPEDASSGQTRLGPSASQSGHRANGIAARNIDAATLRIREFAEGYTQLSGSRYTKDQLLEAVDSARDGDQIILDDFPRWWKTELWLTDRSRDTVHGKKLRECTLEHIPPNETCHVDLSIVIGLDKTRNAMAKDGQVEYVETDVAVIDDDSQPVTCESFAKCVANAWIDRKGTFKSSGEEILAFNHRHSARHTQWTDGMIEEARKEVADMRSMLKELRQMDQDDIYVRRRIRYIERLAGTIEADISYWEEEYG